MKASNDLKINTKKYIEIYYDYDQSRKKPYRLFERDGFFDSWRIVDDYKTINEAQESGLSRAIEVKDKGLCEKGRRKGMMSWWEEPKPVLKVVPELSANFEYSEVVEVEKKFLRRASKG